MLSYLPELLKGLHTSLTLTVASLLLALLLALLFTVFLSLKIPVLSQVVRGFRLTARPILPSCFTARSELFLPVSGNPVPRWG